MEQSGRDLHEPLQLSSECVFPIKSAIKSSKSAIVANRPSAVSQENCATFKSSGTNGPFSSQSSGGFLPNSALGTVSPQWGWYTTGSTTPPSPELFAHSGRKPSSTQDGHASQVNSSSLGPSVGLSSAAFVNMDRRRAGLPLHSQQDTHPRPAFTKNTKGILNNSRGWPSVPL